MTWGELTKKNHKALYVTVFKDLGLQPAAYNVLLELLLQKEITVAILATHFTGAKLGLGKKRKASRRPVTLPPHLRRFRNKKGTKVRVGWLKGPGSGHSKKRIPQPPPVPPVPVGQAVPGKPGTTVREVRKRLEHLVALDAHIVVKQRKLEASNDVPASVVSMWPHYGFGDVAYDDTRTNLRNNLLGVPAYMRGNQGTPTAKLLLKEMHIAVQQLGVLKSRIEEVGKKIAAECCSSATHVHPRIGPSIVTVSLSVCVALSRMLFVGNAAVYLCPVPARRY